MKKIDKEFGKLLALLMNHTNFKLIKTEHQKEIAQTIENIKSEIDRKGEDK